LINQAVIISRKRVVSKPVVTQETVIKRNKAELVLGKHDNGHRYAL